MLSLTTSRSTVTDRCVSRGENGQRCSRQTEGRSSHCEFHRPVCLSLYKKYKRVCNSVDSATRCDPSSVETMNMDELKSYISDTLRKHNQFKQCAEARRQHHDECYSEECRDEGHELYYDRMVDTYQSCEATLSAAWARLRAEKQRIEQDDKDEDDEDENNTQNDQRHIVTRDRVRSKKNDKNDKNKCRSNLVKECEHLTEELEEQSRPMTTWDRLYQQWLDRPTVTSFDVHVKRCMVSILSNWALVKQLSRDFGRAPSVIVSTFIRSTLPEDAARRVARQTLEIIQKRVLPRGFTLEDAYVLDISIMIGVMSERELTRLYKSLTTPNLVGKMRSAMVAAQ